MHRWAASFDENSRLLLEYFYFLTSELMKMMLNIIVKWNIIGRLLYTTRLDSTQLSFRAVQLSCTQFECRSIQTSGTGLHRPSTHLVDKTAVYGTSVERDASSRVVKRYLLVKLPSCKFVAQHKAVGRRGDIIKSHGPCPCWVWQ